MRRCSQGQLKRPVWRISSDAPQGRWVEQEVERVEDRPPQEEHYWPGGWRESSCDLAYGLEVHDATDTIPVELLNKLFNNPAR